MKTQTKLFDIQEGQGRVSVDAVVSVLREKADKLEANAKIQAKIGNMDSTRNQLNMAHHLRMSASYLE